MGVVKVDRELFNKVKLDLKTNKKKDVGTKHSLSHETIRMINKTSSFKSWQIQKRVQALERAKSLRDYELEYEASSNWLTNRFKWLKK